MRKGPRKVLLFLALVFLTMTALLFQGRLALNTSAAEQGCITAQCHSTMLTSKNVHPVAQTCDSCHEPTVTPHPQQGKKTFKLVQEGGALCAMCHPDKQNYPSVHGPTAAGDCTVCHNPHASDHRALTLKEGAELCVVCHSDIGDELKKKVVHPALLDGCTSCHNPHGSSIKKLLSAEGASLCFQCHPDIADKIKQSKSIHAPIKTGRACVSCHAPHASDGAKLLRKTGKELCLECHKDLVKKDYTLLHGPIRDGKCTPCHDPHASPYGRLLVKSFPSDFYASYSDKEYELCFGCHNRDLLRFPDTSFATGFRDGERNLHFVHVNKKEKGRSCKTCHAPHGGTLPKLILEKVNFGKWELSLNFVKTDTGGGCAPGCHKKYSYDRKNAAKDVEKARPQENGKAEEEVKKK